MDKKPAKKRLVIRNKKLKPSLKNEKPNTKKDFFELVKRAAKTTFDS